MKTFLEYINKEWTFTYIWTQQDTQDLDVPEPGDEDIEKFLSDLVENETEGNNSGLPEKVIIDFTSLEDKFIIPASFFVKSNNIEDGRGKYYSKSVQPRTSNKKYIVTYEKDI